jgi:hypothetical protein
LFSKNRSINKLWGKDGKRFRNNTEWYI